MSIVLCNVLPWQQGWLLALVEREMVCVCWGGGCYGLDG